MTETEYLRAELTRAKGLLADARGIIRAVCDDRPLIGEIPTVQKFMQESAEFQTRGVAVLPEGVTPCLHR